MLSDPEVRQVLLTDQNPAFEPTPLEALPPDEDIDEELEDEDEDEEDEDEDDDEEDEDE